MREAGVARESERDLIIHVAQACDHYLAPQCSAIIQHHDSVEEVTKVAVRAFKGILGSAALGLE